MTNEQEKAKELAELLNAFADGKQFEFFDCDNNRWQPISCKTMDDVCKLSYSLRIKPETKQIPLTKEDLIDRVKEGKTMWIRLIESSTYQQIIAFGKEHLTVNGGTLYYGVLVNNYEFLDGTPFYKEVECE